MNETLINEIMKEIFLPTPIYMGLCIFVILVLLIAYLEVRKCL